MRQRVEDAPWQSGVSKCVAVEQQRIAADICDGGDTCEQVCRQRSQLVVGEVQVPHGNALEQARRQSLQVVATQVEVTRIRQICEVIDIQ